MEKITEEMMWDKEKVWYDTPAGNIVLNITDYRKKRITIGVDIDIVRSIKEKTNVFLGWYAEPKEIMDDPVPPTW